MTCAELPEDVPIRLYGSGKARGQTIDLENLPCTVGKLSEYADAVLDAPSVSRMHVRFSRNARGELVMKDLNSTNGTFRNGLALKPEEEVRIERGDVIRIGALEFFCR
jgi:pSer/pThr/pTyr-binding forkhead associated (FHA) protein